MKKLIITTAFILSGISFLMASTGKSLNFSGAQSFKREFPDATMVSYKNVNQFVAVNFVSNDTKMEAFYSADGELVAKSKAIYLSDLPSNAAESINKKYADWTTGEVIEYDNFVDNVSCYYVSLVKENKKIILQVDKDGHVSLYH